MSLILACFSTGLAMAATAQVHLEELSPGDHPKVPKNVFKKKKMMKYIKIVERLDFCLTGCGTSE